MEFHNLSRKELQALCKKNKIPANMTNVAMADALSALQHVEGLEDLLQYPSESNPQESPEKLEIGSPTISRTAYRTSTRRKRVKEEPKTSQALTRLSHGSSSTSAEKNAANEKNNDSNLLQTPAAPKTQKRVTVVSSRRKTETRKEESSVQRVYSTRRSVRMLEKTMENLCLTGNEQTEPLKVCNVIGEMPERSEFNSDKADDSNTNKDLFSLENEEEVEADIGEGSNTNEVKMLKENPENWQEEKDEDNALKDEVIEGPNDVSATEVEDEPETQYETSKLENMEVISIEYMNQEEENVNSESIEASAEMKDQLVSENSGLNTSVGDAEESDETMDDDHKEESFSVSDVEIVEEDSDDITESEETTSELDPSSDDEELVDINVREEEGSMTSNYVKQTSHTQVEDDVNNLIEVAVKQGEEISMGSFNSSSIPIGQLSGQFPRPTIISSSVEIKKPAILKTDDEEENKTENTTILKVDNDASDDDEEVNSKNASDDASDNDEEVNSKNALDKRIENLSLRQLRKKLKELNISKKKIHGEKDTSKAGGKTRTALQPIAENCIPKDGQ